MQPGDVWNADWHVKQEGAFASALKFAFRLLASLCLYTTGLTNNSKEHSVRLLLIKRDVTELLIASQKIYNALSHISGLCRGKEPRLLHKDGKFLHTSVTFNFYTTVLAVHNERWQQHSSDTDNVHSVTIRSVRATILQWKSNGYYTISVCVCSLSYPAWNVHELYCHLWPTPLYNTFPYLINGTIFGEKFLLSVKCV